MDNKALLVDLAKAYLREIGHPGVEHVKHVQFFGTDIRVVIHKQDAPARDFVKINYKQLVAFMWSRVSGVQS